MAVNFDGFSDSACMPVFHYGDEMTVIPFDGVFVLLGVFDDGGLIPIAESEAGSVLLESCFQISPRFTNVDFSTFAWYFVDSSFLVVWMLVFVGVEYRMEFVGGTVSNLDVCCLKDTLNLVRGLTDIGKNNSLLRGCSCGLVLFRGGVCYGLVGGSLGFDLMSWVFVDAS